MSIKNFITFIFIALCLCGCAANEPTDSPSAEAQVVTPSVTPTAPVAEITPDEKTPEFTFSAPVAEGLPEFTFEVFETELNGAYEYGIHVSCDDLSEYEPQTIKIESSVNWTEDNISLIDIDFDGFADIQAFTSSGTVNINYEYYRWNVFSGQGYGEFEETPFFELLTTDYVLYPDTKQIISTSRDSAVNHPREMFQLSDTQNGGWLGEYRLLRREEQELTSDGGLVVKVYFGDEVIYTETVKMEDDGYTASGELDNYLRFGVGEPIDIEAATQLLYAEIGEADSDTGFPFMFTFEEMIVFEKLSCYKFLTRWLVDNSHWSTVGFVGVTPDGRIIEI